MSKKRYIIFLSFVIIISCCCCGSKKNTVATEQKAMVAEINRKNVVETDKNTGEKYYLLADFENYFETTQVKYAADFGKVTMIEKSENPDMVTYGNGSIKVEIEGNEETWLKQEPYLRINTRSGFFNLTTDFSNMTKFTFDIYNNQETTSFIRFFLSGDINPRSTIVDRVISSTNYECGTSLYFDLEPKKWNHIEIPADEIKQIAYDTDGKPYNVTGAEALKSVGGFDMIFDRGELHEIPEVFYIDNVRAYIFE